MDIFAHALWTGAGYKIAKEKGKKGLNVWLAALLGVAPDLFAFTLMFVTFFWADMFGSVSFEEKIFELTPKLYEISHSIVVFAIVFGLIWLIRKKPFWELGGWLVHILIDIPTHSTEFYPTPFLWPLSDAQVNGLPWATPWFLILNYTCILVVYLGIYFYIKRKNKIKE